MKRFSISPPVAALLLAVVLFLLSGLLPNSYGSNVKVAVSQATNILRLAVFLGVIAAGQTLVIISGSEGIDLSAGAVVTLTATPAAGSSFVGWSGGLSSAANPVTLTMMGDMTVTATFTLSTYALVIVTDGNGSGAVTPNGAGDAPASATAGRNCRFASPRRRRSLKASPPPCRAHRCTQAHRSQV